jgi:hypothetical protein
MWSQSLELVNTFIAALRISTGYTTGYDQFLTLPVGWTSGYTADLTPLDAASVPNYPPAFERGAWNDEVPTVSSSQLKA